MTYVVSASYNRKHFKHLLPSQLLDKDTQSRIFLVNEEDFEKQTKDSTVHFRRVYSIQKNKIDVRLFDSLTIFGFSNDFIPIPSGFQHVLPVRLQRYQQVKFY